MVREKPKLFPYNFLFPVHSTHIYLPMKMEQTECSETSTYKLQTPGNYPKENIQQVIFNMVHYCYNVHTILLLTVLCQHLLMYIPSV